ncbi:hypothetical protein MLD38_002916 [Melastoma candidum]|uniref:Uncharacterized protein n=1 Tax=Melastoma candidum TaxID=119954 RepID=A0ACB9S5C0_9MYRT|nr:hypothetical protein MLD38_002916 [Melastoma candidum]
MMIQHRLYILEPKQLFEFLICSKTYNPSSTRNILYLMMIPKNHDNLDNLASQIVADDQLRWVAFPSCRTRSPETALPASPPIPHLPDDIPEEEGEAEADLPPPRLVTSSDGDVPFVLMRVPARIIA